MLTSLLGVLSTLSSCAGSGFDTVPPVPTKAEAPDFYRPTPAASFTIAPGDKLSINSYFHPALRQSLTVQPDGRISLLLVGTVVAAGKTPDQFAKELVRAYDNYVEHSEFSVNVDEAAALIVYVGGEVAKPTVLPLKGDLTLLQSITEAGGFLSTANKQQVLIVRQTANRTFRTLQANADQVLHNEADEIYLRQHDIVFVPKSAIAKVDQFVDQYLSQTVPRWIIATFGFNYLLNGASVAAPTVVTSPTQ
jgi:protein involved in polysaccharide export with SLBB domain